MSLYCSYKDCCNIQRAFTNKTFFNLPNDGRREIWIKNSGNEQLQTISLSSRRVFCEDHFDPKYLRRQFNRTLLRREAIPYPYGETPAPEEIEYIEMAESEEEQEKSQTELSNPIEESKKVVVLLNKMPTNERNQQNKEIFIKTILNKNSHEKRPKISNHLKRKQQDETNDTVDVIVLEENSQESLDKSDDENDVNASSNPSKKNIQLESITAQSVIESHDQEKKIEEIVIRKTPPPIKPVAIKKTTNSINEIVSSSENVDGNNEETYFALSLVGILKRLPAHKRAIAKCHILSYLTELEYGSSSMS